MILVRLRDETRDAHQRLEARLNILEDTLSLAAYKDLLRKFYGFYFPLELRLIEARARVLPEFDFDARRKVPLLKQDLTTFGHTPDQLAALPCCRDLPTVKTAAQLLGCLYVVEGATLGGKIISRHLQATHGLDATNGAAFFNGYGSENGPMWRAFGETLTRYAEMGADDASIVQSAVDTFTAFEAWFVNSGFR